MSNGTINKVILVGNLGKDPEIRTTNNGKEMASFSLATSEIWADKMSGVRTEKTEWHNIVVFSEGLVKIIKDFARKGSKIYIEGSLKTRKWVDQNGHEKYTTEVILHNFNSTITLLDSRANNQFKQDTVDAEKTIERSKYEDNMQIDDEIPF